MNTGARRPAGDEQQSGNVRERGGRDDGEVLYGRDQLFERPAIAGPISRGYVDLRGDPPSQFLDESTQILTADVGGDADPPLAVLAIDLIGTGAEVDAC